MKKVFQFVCVAALAAGFVACGGAATSTASADSTAVVELAADSTLADTTVVIEVAE